jgi:hypothetical protein
MILWISKNSDDFYIFVLWRNHSGNPDALGCFAPVAMTTYYLQPNSGHRDAPRVKERFAFFSCFEPADPRHPPTGMSNLIRDETREESEGFFELPNPSGMRQLRIHQDPQLWWRKRGGTISYEKIFSTEQNKGYLQSIFLINHRQLRIKKFTNDFKGLLGNL